MTAIRILRRCAPGLALALALFAVSPARAEGAQPFPESNQVAGWDKVGDARGYDAAHLYEYIDGDAEKYLKAGVKGAVTADFAFHTDIEAVADVYTMSGPDGAKTIFDSETTGEGTAVTLGDAGRTSAQSLIFRKGPYVVRIIAYKTAPDLPQALVDLGKGIAARLGQ